MPNWQATVELVQQCTHLELFCPPSSTSKPTRHHIWTTSALPHQSPQKRSTNTSTHSSISVPSIAQSAAEVKEHDLPHASTEPPTSDSLKYEVTSQHFLSTTASFSSVLLSNRILALRSPHPLRAQSPGQCAKAQEHQEHPRLPVQ